jgi:predicted small metal-binding protein
MFCQSAGNLLATRASDYRTQKGRPAGGAMTKVIKCPCGTVVRARDEESLVAQAQKHAREVHAMELTREQVLAMAGPE